MDTPEQIKLSSEKAYKSFKELLEVSETWDQEKALIQQYVSLVLKKINGKQFEANIKKAYFSYIQDLIYQIRQDAKYSNLLNAYYDVARYQTDLLDASIEWHVDNRLLAILLEHCPVPTTPEGRHALKIPLEVEKLREF